MPAAKQKRSKLAETSSNALPTALIAGEVKTAAFVLIVFMALLSFRGISTPSLPAQGEQRRSSFFNKSWDIPINHDIADSSQRYMAYYAANPFADDGLCIGRVPEGLLNAVYFQGNDRTGDVLLNVIQLAGTIASPPVPRPPLAASPAPAPNFVSMIIDPTNDQDIRSFEQKLGRGFRLSIGGPPARRHPFLCPKDSICFATRVTVPVKITYHGELVLQSTVDVVDPTAYGSIDVSRAFMTTEVTKLDFDHGVLIGLRIRRDSEALAVSEFPLQAIERLVAVPGNGIAVAFGTYDQKTQYLKDQQELTKLQSSANPPSQPQALADVGPCLPADPPKNGATQPAGGAL